MKKITTVETALTVLYPGYFEMSVGEMDEYVRQLSPDPMEVESHSVYEGTTSTIFSRGKCECYGELSYQSLKDWRFKPLPGSYLISGSRSLSSRISPC